MPATECARALNTQRTLYLANSIVVAVLLPTHLGTAWRTTPVGSVSEQRHPRRQPWPPIPNIRQQSRSRIPARYPIIPASIPFVFRRITTHVIPHGEPPQCALLSSYSPHLSWSSAQPCSAARSSRPKVQGPRPACRLGAIVLQPRPHPPSRSSGSTPAKWKWTSM